MNTGAEMDACDTQPTDYGQQVWCIGYASSGGFSSKVYSLVYGGATPTPTAIATLTATRTSTPAGTPTAPPASTSTPTPTSTQPAPTASSTATIIITSTNVPTATATTAVATSTDTPTETAVPPTPCTIAFSDVPAGSTFYTYIHCLACRGILGGYPDGTFRPNNNVTRGQLSKIISNAAGFNDSQPTQMFQDVPIGSTFQVYIGRLASRGYISGYQCGGAGEPCVPPDNLPYFRPGSNASRGQISKIVSNAAGFNDPPGAQMFEDVPPGSAFFNYVQRLASRGIVSGYQCGGPGEQCVPPDNLPYFRPNADVTRGQAAKIVANTFFPNCR